MRVRQGDDIFWEFGGTQMLPNEKPFWATRTDGSGKMLLVYPSQLSATWPEDGHHGKFDLKMYVNGVNGVLTVKDVQPGFLRRLGIMVTKEEVVNGFTRVEVGPIEDQDADSNLEHI